jgi:hypothetical protein
MDRRRDVRFVLEGRTAASQVAQLASQFFVVVSPVHAFIGVANVNEILVFENAQ